MKKLSSYILHYWYAYLFAIVCLLLQVGLDMLAPQVTRRIVDDVIGEGAVDLLMPLLLTIFLIGLGRCVFGYTKEFTFDYVGAKIGMNMRRNLFRHIQKLSINYFDNTNTGELMSRVKDDIDNIWSAVGFIGMLILEVIFQDRKSVV